MQILELNLRHFGRFCQQTIPFHSGLNIIYGGNESGKSTICAFIRAMLFGLEPRGRGGKVDEYSLRQPWDNGSWFEGSMRVEKDGIVYRIERNFYKPERSVRVICETYGQESEDPEETIAQLLDGVSEQIFCNTVFLAQNGAATDRELAAKLQSYMLNARESGEGTMDADGALRLLKQKRRALEAEKKTKREQLDSQIFQGKMALSVLKDDIERMNIKVNTAGEGRSEGGKTAYGDVTAQQAAAGGTAQDEYADQYGDKHAGEYADQYGDKHAGEYADQYGDVFAGAEDESDPKQRRTVGILSEVVCLLALCCAVVVPGIVWKTVMVAAGVLFGLAGAAMFLSLGRPSSGRRLAGEDDARRNAQAAAGSRYAARGDARAAAGSRYTAQGDTQAAAGSRYAAQGDVRAAAGSRYTVQGDIRTAEGSRPAAPAEARMGAGSRPAAQGEARMEGAGPEEFQSVRLAQMAAQKEELQKLYRENDALSSYDTEIEALDLAAERIRMICAEMVHRSGRDFGQEAGRLLGEITEGRYTAISLDDQQQIRINTPERLLHVSQVSFGTMNQIYFAFRMASGEMLGAGDLPLVLDEPFCMYDDERLAQVLAWLKNQGRQVILFTCQTREKELLEQS